jgi:hypothetical protein
VGVAAAGVSGRGAITAEHLRDGSERQDDQRLRWSSAWWSPPPESNRRPHPYHGSGPHRRANSPSRRSRDSARGEVMGSVQLCYRRTCPAHSSSAGNGWHRVKVPQPRVISVFLLPSWRERGSPLVLSACSSAYRPATASSRSYCMSSWQSEQRNHGSRRGLAGEQHQRTSGPVHASQSIGVPSNESLPGMPKSGHGAAHRCLWTTWMSGGIPPSGS